MRGRTIRLGFAIGLLLPAVAGEGHADREGATFGVDDYGSGDLCEGIPLDYPTSQESAFYQEISLYAGAHAFDVIERNQNGMVDGRDFIDKSLGGQDHLSPRGTDWADVVMFSGHGGKYYCSATALKMGDDSNSCEPYLTSEIQLGGVDTGTLVMDASNCLEKCVWDWGGFDTLDQGGSGTELAVANGYHGSPGDDLQGVQEIGDFAYYAKMDGLGDDWVDIMFTEGTYDDCAVTIVYADNASEADDAFYYAGLADQHSTGNHDYQKYWYISGCAPKNGATLP